jgi:AbiU2
LDGARTFFGLTVDGSLELAQMAIARLYDRTRGAVTIPVMLARATEEIDSFRRGDREQIVKAIKKAQNAVTGLASVPASIHARRSEWLAHLDPRTVGDPAALAVKAKLDIPDLDRAFKETEDIVLEMSSLYEGVIGELHFLGDDDYKSALNWIRKAKCTYIEGFEREHEVGSWKGPRPQDCSRAPWNPILACCVCRSLGCSPAESCFAADCCLGLAGLAGAGNSAGIHHSLVVPDASTTATSPKDLGESRKMQPDCIETPPLLLFLFGNDLGAIFLGGLAAYDVIRPAAVEFCWPSSNGPMLQRGIIP